MTTEKSTADIYAEIKAKAAAEAANAGGEGSGNEDAAAAAKAEADRVAAEAASTGGDNAVAEAAAKKAEDGDTTTVVEKEINDNVVLDYLKGKGIELSSFDEINKNPFASTEVELLKEQARLYQGW